MNTYFLKGKSFYKSQFFFSRKFYKRFILLNSIFVVPNGTIFDITIKLLK
jgi:hypothetical protein